MADRRIVVCELLCYLAHKFRKLPNKVVSSVLVDFYSHEDIVEAKETLLNDVDALNLEKWARPSRRRDSDLGNRACKEVSDILSTWALIDEGSLWSKMPTYVTKNLENIPPVRMEEGEYKLLCHRVAILTEKVEKKNEEDGAYFEHIQEELKISKDIARALNDISQLMQNIQHDLSTKSSQNRVQRSVKSADLRDDASSNNNIVMNESWFTTCLHSDQHKTMDSDLASGLEQETVPKRVDNFSQDGDNEEEPFRQYNSRRQAGKRRRLEQRSRNEIPGDNNCQGDSLHRQRVSGGAMDADVADAVTSGRRWETIPARSNYNHPGLTQQTSKLTNVKEDGKKESLVGTSTNPNMRIKAARSLLRKSFFYVGNVASTTEKEMRSFIEDLGIRVISCFVTGKHNSDNDEIEGRDDSESVGNAFRVCINAEDSPNFMNPSTWPQHFLLRRWTFGSKEDKKENTKPKTPKNAVSRSPHVDNGTDAQMMVMDNNQDGD